MITLVLLIIGLCFGSFVNALTWRIHEQVSLSSKKKPSNKDKELASRLSVLSGRSMCPNCKHVLSAFDLVPVLSYLSLKGKCRYCKTPISGQYPLVELITALLFAASYVWWPVPITGAQVALFVVWLIMLIGLVALGVYDLKWMKLPNRIIYPLTWLALATAIIRITAASSPLKALGDVILAVLVGGGVFYVLFQVSQGKWIGGGDVRLGALLGLSLPNPGSAILLLLVASVSGTLFSLPLLALKRLKRDSVIPFGPFLILGAIIVQLFGQTILLWYQNNFFPNGI